MRVLFTSHSGELWGAERSLLELIQELPIKGVEPFLACPPGTPLEAVATESRIPVLPLPVHRINRKANPLALARVGADLTMASAELVRLVRRHRIDLLHANSTVAQFWTGPAARIVGIPSVWHWRDFYEIRWLNRILARMVSVSVAVSQSIYQFAVSQLGREHRIVLVMNGIRDHACVTREVGFPSWRSKLGIRDSEILVVLLGQAIRRKGHEILLRAIASAMKQDSRLHAVFASPQTDEEAAAYVGGLRGLAVALGTVSNSTFIGDVRKPLSLLAEADIVAVPSLREPFGRVAVEAMIVGRPVVASCIDGLAEVVADGVTGLLVPSENPQAFAQALLTLASNPALREAMGQAGRRRATEQFCIRSTADSVMDIYRNLLHERDR